MNSKLLVKVITELPDIRDEDRNGIAEIVYLEYRKVGNLLMPAKTVVKASNSVFYNSLDISCNVQIPETAFAVPVEVQKPSNK